MMKILYGVQGTGNGHITRARVMAKAFQKNDTEIDFVFSGRQPGQYFDMEIFGEYRAFEGLSFSSHHGQINYFKTAQNLNISQFIKDVKQLDISTYDLIINDFEPVTAWAAKLTKNSNAPVINISHQASFTFPTVPATGLNWWNKQLLKYFAPADINLGVHWYHFGANILPPFIEHEVSSEQNGNTEQDTLVYLPFDDLTEIVDVLNSQHLHKFKVYHPDVTEDIDEAAVKLRKPCRQGFLRSLEDCTGVIANAGFELSSEALTLGKKLLLKPLQGQFEQASNAHTLSKLGLATTLNYLNEDEIEKWLALPNGHAINYPSDPKPVVDWLCAGNYSEPEKLCAQLWQPITTKAFTQGIVS